MTSIAIVILNWNGKSLLEKFLPDVISNSSKPGIEVIVADNASTDDSCSFLKSVFPQIRLIRLEKNYGFAGGYNRALQQVEADFYLLLNSDVLPGTNWMGPLLEAIEQFPDASAFMPKIKSYHQPTHFEYAGAAGGFIDQYGFPFCRGRLFNVLEEDLGQYNQPSEIFWASGAAFLIKADLYRELGGLDESFFAHMEEIDLCWRLKNRGHKIMYIPGSEVFHVGGASLHQSHPRKTYLNFRNNLFLLLKNLPKGKLIPILFFRMILDGIAAVKFLFSLEFGFAFAVLKAHLSFYRHLPALIQSRKILIRKQTVTHHKEIYHRSIVFDFFFRGIRKFSMLNFN